MKRRLFLLLLGSLGAYSSCAVSKQNHHSMVAEEKLSQDSNLLAQENTPSSLRELAASKGLIYGAFPQRGFNDFDQDIPFKSVFLRESSLLVGGFYGVSIGPQNGNMYNFQAADNYFNFAKENNLKFRGHPLIWNEFNSPWLVEKFKNNNTTSSEIQQVFVSHISTVVKRYAGQVHSWDVVNEAINPEDGRPDGLRDTLKSGIRGEFHRSWLHFLGPEHIELAFRVAAEADPNAILTYNEHSMEYNFGWQERRRQVILKTLERLKARGIPIHALGIQSHLNASWNQYFDGKRFRTFLSDIASLGLEIMITELDVMDRDLSSSQEDRDRQIAQAYYQYLSVALDEPAVSTVINWGLSDRYTWLSSFAPRPDGEPVRPLPFDSQLNYKQSWSAIAKAFEEAPSRNFSS